LHGNPVLIGDVVDVSSLGSARIANLEKSGYGLRVSDETKLTPARKPAAVPKPPRSKTPPAARQALDDDDGFLDLEPEVAVAGARKPRAPKRSPRRRAAAPQ